MNERRIQGVYPSIPTPKELPGLEEAARVGGNEGIGEVVELKGDAAGLQIGDLVTFGKAQVGICYYGVVDGANLTIILDS